MATVLDEIVEKAAQLSVKERAELIQLLQQQENKVSSKSKTGNIHPNTMWIKKHRKDYAGNYVVLKDGELIAHGKAIKEADLKAKEKGFTETLLHYIPAEDEEVWGGW